MLGANRVRGPYRKQLCDECAEAVIFRFFWQNDANVSHFPSTQFDWCAVGRFFNNLGGIHCIATAYTNFCVQLFVFFFVISFCMCVHLIIFTCMCALRVVCSARQPSTCRLCASASRSGRWNNRDHRSLRNDRRWSLRGKE